MTRAQQMRAVDEGLVGEQRQCRGIDPDDAPTVETPCRDIIDAQLAVGLLVRAEREEFMVGAVAHGSLRTAIRRRIFVSQPASSVTLPSKGRGGASACETYRARRFRRPAAPVFSALPVGARRSVRAKPQPPPPG